MNKCMLFITLAIPGIALGAVDEFGGVADECVVPVMYRSNRSSDSPVGWLDDERLSDNDGIESFEPRGVVDMTEKIHVVWKDRQNAKDEIHYRVRTDETWSSPFIVTNPDTNHNSPWIAADKIGNIHVVFLRWFGTPFAYYDVGYRKYNNSLTVWEPEERITYYDSIGLIGRPKVLCDTGGVVYAFWLDQRDVPMTINYATNNGAGWSAKRAVTDINDSPYAYFGAAVAPDNTIHCVWQDDRSGTSELYHRYFQNGIWSSASAITSNGFTSVYPRLSADVLSNMHLIYGGGSSLSEKIHYRVWNSASHGWGPETIFPSQMAWPHVDIEVSRLDSDVHLTFHESVSGNMEIMYKHYDAQSAQWEPNVQLTFGYPDLRLDPQICLDPTDYVHLFWWDMRDGTGQEEIYYKTNRLPPQQIEEVKTEDGLQLSVYPNPFIGYATILGHEKERFFLYDITGKTMGTYQGDKLGVGLPPGVYFVVSGDKTIKPVRIVKVR